MKSRLLQAFSLALLGLQALLPWLYPDFHVQDGPAHLYTAASLRAVLAGGGSPLQQLYELNRIPVPNWTNTAVFTAAGALVGQRHAEALAFSLYVLAAYFCFSYALRALAPGWPLFHPVLNALVWPKYLFFGFFNFYLGIAGMAFTLAFFIRHWAGAGWRLYLRLGGLLLLLYFTHLVTAFLAAGALLAAGVWLSRFPPATARPSTGPLRRMLPLSVLMLPLLALTLLFIVSAHKGVSPVALSVPAALGHLQRFPFEAFEIAQRPFLDQKPSLAALLILMAIGFLHILRKRDTSAAALLLWLAAALALLSFFVPDAAFGGAWFKQRLGWVSVILGSVGAAALARPPVVVRILQCAAGALMSVTVLLMLPQAGRIGAAYAEFNRIESRIRPGATLMRITLPLSSFPDRYGIQDLVFLPFQHAELLIAARRDCFALTDLQALLGFYPLVMTSPYPPATRERLLLLADDPPPRPAPHLETLFRDLPELPGYVLVIGAGPSSPPQDSVEDTPLREVERVLSPRYENVAPPEAASFVRLYRLRAAAPSP